MRSSTIILGAAFVLAALGLARFVLPAAFEQMVAGSESCDDKHLTAAQLEAFVPDYAHSMKQVYEHCKDGDIPSEAAVDRAYASKESLDGAAQLVLSGAQRAGWTRATSGKPVVASDGSITLPFARTEHGQDVLMYVRVFRAESSEKPNPNADMDKIQRTGLPTGVVLRIWADSESPIPTVSPGKVGMATPPSGLRR